MLSYKDLTVWQKGMDLVEEIYALARKLPKEETYALSDQMRRAAISVPSNIAEGKNRNSVKEYINFLSIARGSVAELDTQILLCIRLHYISEEEANNALSLCTETGRMLWSLIESLRDKV